MRLIDADALKKQLLDYYKYSMQTCVEVSDFIDHAPTIDPQRTGEWIPLIAWMPLPEPWKDGEADEC